LSLAERAAKFASSKLAGGNGETAMGELSTIDWHGVFVPALGLAEIVLRGTIMYLALFAILRFIARRQAGNFGPADLLVIVLIADAAQNGLGKDYNSVTEGIVLVLTIVFWEYALDWLAWRVPALRPILNAPPLKLIDNGLVVEMNMAAEMLTRDELMSQLRQDGVDQISAVKDAWLEGDGRLSVLKKH
jgi:uncharacterized membrane protein YcaP (DUF421 family)